MEKRSTFRQQVLDIVRGIPRGSTMTYGEVARAAGNTRAARAVGMIMSHNYDPAVPCHRVIRSDGTPGGYNRGAAAKVLKLQQEGAIA